MTTEHKNADPDSAIPAPNMTDWMREHLARYLATNGADGHLWNRPGFAQPLPTLVLTTTGRKSGQRYLNPLIYGEANGAYVVIASAGGAKAHPGWYLNLAAKPNVDVQVRERKFKARARTVSGAEREVLWTQMEGIFPVFIEYKRVAGREIPLVVLDPS